MVIKGGFNIFRACSQPDHNRYPLEVHTSGNGALFDVLRRCLGVFPGLNFQQRSLEAIA
jgi:hypothetical protein